MRMGVESGIATNELYTAIYVNIYISVILELVSPISLLGLRRGGFFLGDCPEKALMSDPLLRRGRGR